MHALQFADNREPRDSQVAGPLPVQGTEERVVTRVRRDPLGETEVDDCRWTPCLDCGVCPQMGTEIEIGPTGMKVLPLRLLGSARHELLEHQH